MTETDLSVYLITTPVDEMIDITEKAIKGGASMVQFRDKIHDHQELMKIGAELRDLTARHKIPFIVNDDLDLAIELKADGLHVGQDDVDAEKARKALGDRAILGVSAGTIEEAIEAEKAGADYIGVGDLYGTSSKDGTGGAMGLEKFEKVVKSVSIPSVAIGGITLENTEKAIRAGASGVSVISAIFSSDNPYEAAKLLKETVKRGKNR